MLILAAAVTFAAAARAQQDDPGEQPRAPARLGDQPVENEYQLDLSVPEPKPVEAAPETSAQRAAREAFEREMTVERHLTAGHQAFKQGQVDQPPGESAWFHYRAALEIDPGNADAEAGLLRVQDELVARAKDYAQDLDFESARRVLEDALLVRQDQAAIDRSWAEIEAMRTDQAGELEARAVTAMDAGDFDRAERLLIELIALGGTDAQVTQLRRRMEEARVYGGFEPGEMIRDHFLNQGTWTPELVIVTAGSFTMGSSAFEEGREDHEGPEHRVVFRRGFAIGRTEVTVKQFRQFVDRTRYRSDAEKQGHSNVFDHYSGRLTRRDGVSWEMNYEGRAAADDEPVVHVSWNDALAYVRWLAQGTGKAYRLPTEAEFEYAVRAGKVTRYWWGDGVPRQAVENLTGERDVSRSQRQWSTFFRGYGDGYWGPAPVASFPANPFGLHDIGGNVAEWVTDCWHDTYVRAPADGSAWVNPGCKQRVIRGGFWASSPEQSRSAYRVPAAADHRGAWVGFRIARDL